jgi:hypothetical protein
MSTRNAFAMITLAALLVFTGLARTAAAQQASPQAPSSAQPNHSMQNMPGMGDMPGMNPGMNMDHDTQDHAQSGAMTSMGHGHHMMDGAHMHMTDLRQPPTADEVKRGDEIAASLREAILPYKDYRVALSQGYRIFAPNLPQDVYHFTNYWNGFLEGFTFDAARPTSLLYKKTKDGYELVGAMYTAPKTATLDQLNERVPLSIAQWHVHTNLCIPPRGQIRAADWKKFGLTGSISTAEACKAAGGRFYPQIFGWMVHVYPFESSREKIFGQ